jgi:KaiC/GvpD/RAD55 family RecA-like ATPase
MIFRASVVYMVSMKLNELEKLGDQYSVLVITPVEKMQDTANRIIKSYVKSGVSGVYIALNKPHESIEKIMKAESIKTDKLFFIDCMNISPESGNGEKVAHIQNPSDLTSMNIAVNQFMEKMGGKKFLMLDSLTTMLIYNKENLVIMFVKSLIDEMRRTNSRIVILTPELRGGELLNKISLFFDKIVKI